MLVLSRKKEQEVCLPELGINIKVLRIDGNKVKLGIEAPDDIHILRGELNDVRGGFLDDATLPFRNESHYAEQVA